MNIYLVNILAMECDPCHFLAVDDLARLLIRSVSSPGRRAAPPIHIFHDGV
jgi:hypothetical protein